MYEVFISYSNEDYDKADKLRRILVRNGLSCWFAPKDIEQGDFTEIIPKKIKESRAFVLVLSQAAQSSQWVKREMDFAVGQGRTIFPFAIEKFDLDEKFDFMIGRNTRYEAYVQEENAIGKLVRDLYAVLDKPLPVFTTTGEDGAAQEPVPEQKPAKQPAETPVEKKPGKKKTGLWIGLAVAAVALVGILLAVLLSGGGGDEGFVSGEYVVWNPAYGMAMSGDTVNTHYHAGVSVRVAEGVPEGYSDIVVWQIQVFEDGSFTMGRDGKTLGIEPGYNGIGLGGSYSADRWVLEDAGNGLCYIRNVETGNYLEWYEDKNNWSTYERIIPENQDMFCLQLTKAE